MSVTISEYCLSHDNKLVKCLKRALDDGIFLDCTLMNVNQRDDDWWCDFLIDYTLSCNDFAQLADTFAGYWWCVSTYFATNGYRLLINLKNDLL